MPIHEPSKDGHLAYSPGSGHPWISHALAIPICGPSTDGHLAYPNRIGDEGCAALSRGLKECRELQKLE